MNFLPLQQGQGSFRPVFSPTCTGAIFSGARGRDAAAAAPVPSPTSGSAAGAFSPIPVVGDLGPSTLVSYTRQEGLLTLILANASGRHRAIAFEDVIGIQDFGTWEVVAIAENHEPAPWVGECLARLYGVAPAEHDYHHYVVLNEGEYVVMQIVARDIRETS